MKINITRSFIAIACLAFLNSTSVTLYGQLLRSKITYLKGYYTDNADEKHEGYIGYDEMNYKTFYYKPQLADKKTKLGLDDASGFLFGDRTFQKINNVKIGNGLWKVNKNEVFAEVVTEGKASLYRVFGQMNYSSTPTYGAGGMMIGGYINRPVQLKSYLLKVQPDSTYYLLPKGQENFREQVSKLLQDDQIIVEKLSSKGYKIDNIQEIVDDYNSRTK